MNRLHTQRRDDNIEQNNRLQQSRHNYKDGMVVVATWRRGRVLEPTSGERAGTNLTRESTAPRA